MYMRNYVSKEIQPIEASLEDILGTVAGTVWPFKISACP